MVFFRFVFGLLFLAGLVCFVLYAVSGQVVWRRRGVAIVKWTVFTALGFFAVLIVGRLVDML